MVLAKVLVHDIVLYFVNKFHVKQLWLRAEEIANYLQAAHLPDLVKFGEHKVVDVVRRQLHQLEWTIDNLAIWN